MVITHQGGQCFKVSFGDTTIAFDPISKGSKLGAVKFGATIAFVSLDHPNFNGVDQVTYGDRSPFVARGAGEYEIGDVTAQGFDVLTTYEKEKRYNTIYRVKLEGMNLVFLGALGDSTLDTKILEALGSIDVLFVPIGGGDVLDVPAASALGVKLEARVVIPMHYDLPDGKVNEKILKAFLKEEGAEGTKPVEKLTIKKKDVESMEGQIVVLKA